MSEAKLNWGILGAARVNERLLPAIIEAPNSRLVAIASRRAGAALATLQKYAPHHQRDVQCYDDLESLIQDADVQAIYCPMANEEHAEWAIKAIKAGKHVLIEKPMAIRLQAINAIYAAANQYQVKVMEGFMSVSYTHLEATLRRQVAEEIGLKLAEGQEAGPIDLTNPKVQKAIDALHDTLTKKGMLKKLAAKFEKPKAGHFEEAQEKLTVSIEVKDADLQALAKARGEAIQKTLLDAGVAAERVRLQKAEVIKACLLYTSRCV